MNRKQRGAATEGDVTGAERGWFGRLRAQPGFRTAFVAFCLTVILGVGAPAAYALWSSSVRGMVTVQTVKPPLPVITGSVQCMQRTILGVVSMRYSAPSAAAMPEGVYVTAVISVPDRSEPIYYAVPNTGSFNLKDLHGLGEYIGGSLSGKRISVTVSTVRLDQAPQALPSEIQAAAIRDQADAAPPAEPAYFYLSYQCNRL
ncbi:hypothetical protein [Arthrobacter sp. 3Tela_A]|uniref:hypothetical protein n=1 Tax=Arthrobacter sp. 3Tela_A TaxID=3093743 RepID=UPI003BB4FEBF